MRLHWGSPTNPSTWPQERFQVVYDNNGKDMDSCKALIDANIVRTASGAGAGVERAGRVRHASVGRSSITTTSTNCALGAQGKLKHYVFVASAGAYKANDVEPCHFEGDARKASAGHVEVENYLKVSRECTTGALCPSTSAGTGS